jgi:hypothetical protein
MPARQCAILANWRAPAVTPVSWVALPGGPAKLAPARISVNYAQLQVRPVIFAGLVRNFPSFETTYLPGRCAQPFRKALNANFAAGYHLQGNLCAGQQSKERNNFKKVGGDPQPINEGTAGGSPADGGDQRLPSGRGAVTEVGMLQWDPSGSAASGAAAACRDGRDCRGGERRACHCGGP